MIGLQFLPMLGSCRDNPGYQYKFLLKISFFCQADDWTRIVLTLACLFSVEGWLHKQTELWQDELIEEEVRFTGAATSFSSEKGCLS